MLTNTVIIVLREVLEVAYLASFLLAISVFMHIGFRWFYCALGAGVLGASLYAYYFKKVSECFDYSGQEIVNAVLLSIVFLSLVALILLPTVKGKWRRWMIVCMFMVIFFSFVREGAELIIYYSGFSYVNEPFIGIAAGSIIGLGIGLSVGALIYFSLLNIALKKSWLLSHVMLLITACGLLSQAVGFLIQADLISSQTAVWDSRFIVPEDSILGQLLYAVISYESTPELSQLLVWLLAFVLVLGFYVCFSKKGLYAHVSA